MGQASSGEKIKETLQELRDTRKIKTFEDEFWSSYWKSDQMSTKDLLTLVTVEDIRQIKTENRSNFLALCLHCMNQLYKFSKLPVWTTSEVVVANNSVKWLIRLFPVILEDRDLVNYFWEAKNEACLQPYAVCMLQNITEMLFRSDYCVAPKTDEVGTPDPLNMTLLWKPGLVIKEAKTSDYHVDENRKNTLYLLLLSLSQELYSSRDDSIIYPDKWFAWFKSKSNKFSILLFTSLINYVCSCAEELENSWTYFLKGKSFPLLYLSFHLLMLCLSSSAEPQEEETDSDDRASHNIFVDLVEHFHKKDDIDLIISSLNTLISFSNPSRSFLGSAPQFEYHQECLVLLWRFCVINQKFCNFLLISHHMPNIVLSLVVYLHDVRSDTSELGFIHSSLSLLLFLSGERQFVIIMNSVYDGKPFFDLPKNSSYNDYLIYSLAKLLTQGTENLIGLHETIASVVYNISPYLTLLSMAASLTMICMLEAAAANLSSESTSQSAYQVVSLLLDAFNNVLCFGYNNNPYLIFCMILSNKVFYKLDALANSTRVCNGDFDDSDSPLYAFDKDALSILSTKNIVKFLDILVPQVEKLCHEIDDFNEGYVAKFLRRSTIVGIITKPSQLLTRRFEVAQ